MWHSGHRCLGRKQQRVRALSRSVWRLWLILGFSLALASGAVIWFSIRKVMVRSKAITDGLKIFAAANSDAVQKKVSRETQ